MALAAISLVACAEDAAVGPPAAPLDFAATASDFECLKNWERVRNIRLTNKLGRLDEALALARDPQPGGEYPVGTIIQLFPGEAMVKRTKAAFPQSNGWEYFALAVTPQGTTVKARGDEVSNGLGTCQNCHSGAAKGDYICASGGCTAVPLTDERIVAIQKADPRCAQ